MIFTITFFLIQAMLHFFIPIEIHEQIKGLFKSFAMAQSTCPELLPFRNNIPLKMSGFFLVILKLFPWGRLSQFLAYLDLACINSYEIHEQNKEIFLL